MCVARGIEAVAAARGTPGRCPRGGNHSGCRPEHQNRRRGDRQARPAQLVGVGSQLEECLGARTASQLRVADLPALLGADEEVCVPVELAVEERGLIDHVGRSVERLDRLVVENSKRSCRMVGGAVDLPDLGGPVGDEVVQDARFMGFAHRRDLSMSGSGGLLWPRGSTHQHVQVAEQPVLTLSGARQVRRAPHDLLVKKHHG